MPVLCRALSRWHLSHSPLHGPALRPRSAQPAWLRALPEVAAAAMRTTNYKPILALLTPTNKAPNSHLPTMTSVQLSSCPPSENFRKDSRHRSKNHLRSTFQNAGLNLACIMKPSSAGSEALLQAALRYGEQVVSESQVCRKQASKAIPFTNVVTKDEILALPPTECSVCLCNIEACSDDSPAVVLKLDCGHIFHRECIARWLRRDMSCPTCRWQCRLMRHPKVKAAAPTDDDGWIDQPLQAGDNVWVHSTHDNYGPAVRQGTLGKVIEEENFFRFVTVQLNSPDFMPGLSIQVHASQVELVSELNEAAAAHFGRFAAKSALQ